MAAKVGRLLSMVGEGYDKGAELYPIGTGRLSGAEGSTCPPVGIIRSPNAPGSRELHRKQTTYQRAWLAVVTCYPWPGCV